MDLENADIEAWDTILTRVKERAEKGVPPDRWLSWEEHEPFLRAALFWRSVASDLAQGVLEQQARTLENMGIVPDAEKKTG